MADERTSVSLLAKWVGQQLGVLRSLLPSYRSATVTCSVSGTLGAAGDVTVTWSSAFPDTTYWCFPVLTAATAQVTAVVKTRTKTGATITLNPALAGTSVTVYALRIPGVPTA